MNKKYIISLSLLTALTCAPSWGAAGNPNQGETPGERLFRERLFTGEVPITVTDDIFELAMKSKTTRALLAQHNGNLNIALSDAAKKDYPWAIEYLLQHGADVNARDNEGYTALSWAASNGNESTIAQLLAARADVHAKVPKNKTALMMAAQYGHAAATAQLLSAGADVNAKDKSSNTALIWATFYGHEAIVAQLIDAGADVNAQTEDGDTALMWALARDRKAMAKLLIDAGADSTNLSLKHKKLLKKWIEYDYQDLYFS